MGIAHRPCSPGLYLDNGKYLFGIQSMAKKDKQNILTGFISGLGLGRQTLLASLVRVIKTFCFHTAHWNSQLSL